MRDFRESLQIPAFWTWPERARFELIAIAQHHGTPTRLLDWTLDPLVAAYFAATEPIDGATRVNHPAPSKCDMAIWIFDAQKLPDPIIRIPYDLNQNARAQRGAFVNYLRAPAMSSKATPLQRLPFDQSLARVQIPKTDLTKLLLPRSEAKALLHALHRRRISGASMFPGFAGAARAERERLLWETK